MINQLRICDAVNWQIQLSGIDTIGAAAVKNCVASYTRCSSRDGISQKIHYYINRMCNAVKSVFGKSDWQLAEKAITKHVYSYVPGLFRDFVKNKTQGFVHNIAGRTLRLLVVQNNNKLAVPDYVKSIVEGQLLVAKIAVAQVALRSFQQPVFVGLNFMNSFYNTQSYAQWNFTGTPMNASGTPLSFNRTSTPIGGQPNALVPIIARAAVEHFFPQTRLLFTDK